MYDSYILNFETGFDGIVHMADFACTWPGKGVLS